MYSPGKNTIPYYQCTCGYKIIHLKSMQKSNIGKYKKSTKTIVFLYKSGYITCKIITKSQALLDNKMYILILKGEEKNEKYCDLCNSF